MGPIWGFRGASVGLPAGTVWVLAARSEVAAQGPTLMTTVAEPLADPVDSIPPIEVIRARLYRVRQEARLLARLLRISESKAIILPTDPAGPAPGGLQ